VRQCCHLKENPRAPLFVLDSASLEHFQELRTRSEIVADRSGGRSATIGGAIGDYLILENALARSDSKRHNPRLAMGVDPRFD
jgi:hypothetical protein